jgi:hypothetical protein
LSISLSALKKLKITHMPGKKRRTTEVARWEVKGCFKDKKDLDPTKSRRIG